VDKHLLPRVVEEKAQEVPTMAARKSQIELNGEGDTVEAEPTEMDLRMAFREAERKRLAERVPIMLMKDNENYKDDVTVCINGKIYQIQRGVRVMVPLQVKEILDSSNAQEMKLIARMQEAMDVNLGER
jgi:hypothetical protein